MSFLCKKGTALCHLIQTYFSSRKVSNKSCSLKNSKVKETILTLLFRVEGGCDELCEASADPEAVHGAPGSFEAVPSIFQVTSFGCFETIAYVATFEFN